MFRRLELLIGDNIEKLKNASIILFGVGGVGGYVAEMLVRSGIGSITIVDYDVVDISNKNRQIIALNSTIGKNKVDVLKDRLLDINADCKVLAINEKLTKDNIDLFNINNYDYIIDAIDMVTSKIALINYAKCNNIPIISAMGAGNRCGIPDVKIADIYSTSNDGLAKVLRHELRKLNVTEHTVVYCANNSTPCGKTIGSIAYFPAMVGCMLSAYVVEEIIKGEWDGSNCK